MKVIVRPNGIYINKDRYNYTMLDNFIKSPVDLIDIDMYGSEIDVLKGAVNTLLTYRPELDIKLYESRIMKERERIIGLLALVCDLPIDITDNGDRIHVITNGSSEHGISHFRGHQFKYYRNRGPESIMFFTGWTSEVNLREKLLCDDEVVYDVGAHIGAWTIPAALIGKEVYAFEPNIDCCDILHDNLALNGLNNVTVHNIALSNGSWNATVNSCYNDNNTSRAIKLDKVFADPPDFIKIDVEGAELEVIAGARETIHKHKPRLFVETHKMGDRDTYEDVRDLVLKIVPDYLVESEKGLYHIFWPPN